MNISAAAPPIVGRSSGSRIDRCVRSTPAPETRAASVYESPSAAMPGASMRVANGIISVT